MSGEVDVAFSAFVEARYAALVRSAFLLVADAGVAEDLVQSSLFQTYRAWGRLQVVAAAEAYTRTTMLRMAYKWGRRRWHQEIVGLDRTEPSPAPPSPDVSVSLEVRAALAQLPWAQRAVLVLRYFDDLSESDTARLLDCSVGTVKSRASRGLAALRANGVLTAERSAGRSGWDDNESGARHDR
jgi:RNA polymerase sigma-70 factor (sigma-E family)